MDRGIIVPNRVLNRPTLKTPFKHKDNEETNYLDLIYFKNQSKINSYMCNCLNKHCIWILLHTVSVFTKVLLNKVILNPDLH